MNKNKFLIVLLIITFFIAAPAYSKKAKSKRTPKQTVAGLTQKLNDANDRITELSAQNVSLTARAGQMDADMKKFKKDSDAKLYIVLGCGAGAVAVCIAIILILTGAKSAAAGTVTKKKKQPGHGREGHFDELEYNIMDDWHNIWYHPEKINRELYADMNNHFPSLYENIEKWKDSMAKRNDLVDGFIRNISSKFKEIEALPPIHMLALNDTEYFIDENQINAGTFECAHSRPGFTTDRKMMQAFYDETIKMFGSEYSEVRALSIEISNLKLDIDVEIRKIKHHRNLPGECRFIS
jgi:hypothetical protein